MKTHVLMLFILVGLLVSINAAASEGKREIRIPAGQTVDIWFGVNVSGKLTYSIRSRDGTDRIQAWWIRWGVGDVDQLGTLNRGGKLKIPIRWWSGIFSAKLRATAVTDTIVTIWENSSPDASGTIHW